MWSMRLKRRRTDETVMCLADFSRKLLQKVYQGTPATITAKSGTSVVNAIVSLTPSRQIAHYLQTPLKYYRYYRKCV